MLRKAINYGQKIRGCMGNFIPIFIVFRGIQAQVSLQINDRYIIFFCIGSNF